MHKISDNESLQLSDIAGRCVGFAVGHVLVKSFPCIILNDVAPTDDCLLSRSIGQESTCY